MPTTRWWPAALLAVVLAAAGRTARSDVHLPQVERVAQDFGVGDAGVRCALLSAAAVRAVEHEEPAGCPEALERLQVAAATSSTPRCGARRRRCD